MLLVGTNRSLLDLDRSFTLAEDAAVTALAISGGRAFAMLDAERVDRIEEFDCQPEAALPEPSGQSMAMLTNHGRSRPARADLSDAGPNVGAESGRTVHHLVHHHEAQAHADAQVDLLVGMTGARLVRVTSGGEVRPISSFDSLPGRADWENPAGPTPD